MFEKIKWLNSAICSYKKDATTNSKEALQKRNRGQYLVLERKPLDGTKCLDSQQGFCACQVSTMCSTVTSQLSSNTTSANDALKFIT